MADKMSMSLDEIIKQNRVEKARKGGAGGGIRNKFKKGGVAAGKNRIRGVGNSIAAKKIVRRSLQQRQQGRAPANRGNAGNGLQSKAVKELINKAVRREMAKARPAVGIAGRLGGKIPKNIITSRLAALSQRAAGIQKNRTFPLQNRGPRRVNQQLAQEIPQIVQRVVQARPQVQYIREPVQAPPQVIQVVERVAPRARKFGGRMAVQQSPVIQRVAGGGIIRRQQPAQIQRVQVIRQQQPVRTFPKQQIVRRQQQVVYEDELPQQRVQVIRRAVPIQRQTVQVVRQVQQPRRQRGGNVEYVEYVDAPSRAQSNKNAVMRNALGLGGGGRNIVREAPRFEPSGSFLARTVVKKGRGFGGY